MLQQGEERQANHTTTHKQRRRSAPLHLAGRPGKGDEAVIATHKHNLAHARRRGRRAAEEEEEEEEQLPHGGKRPVLRMPKRNNLLRM